MSDEALELFRRSGAFQEGHFQLTSGRHSGAYVEKFQVLQYPAYTERLCRLIADHFRESGVELVAGPTTGGVILSFEVGRQLGVRGIFAESAGGERRFQRGFVVNPGERVLVVDDVLTTGGSIRQVIEAVRAAGGVPIGVAVLVDRTGGQVEFGLPFFACLELVVPSYEVSECPLCRKGVPLTET
jgi:orotate phosphoribosyltransferase